MSSTRCIRLTALAFALLAAPQLALVAGAQEDRLAPSISGIFVRAADDAEGEWLLDFTYVYSGSPPGAVFRIETPPQPGGTSPPLEFVSDATKQFPPKPGRHQIAMALAYPGDGTSGQVIVSILGPDGRVLATERVDQVIRWPTKDERDFDLAYSMIENGSRELLSEARSMLEGLIAKNPQFDDAYVELARVAMKTNWGPEGLNQARTLLDSALQIRPESVNAKILLGYVYAHQRRFDEAERLFVEAAREHPPNVWLWTNWGELLEMQGRADQAEAKYREALERPRSTKWSFSARANAYFSLLRLLEQRNDLDGMDALHARRVEEYGAACYAAEYARFKLYRRHDAQGAIDLARSGLDGACVDTPARQILGLASYAKWAESNGAEAANALNQARAFVPAGPRMLQLLAGHDSTMPAAKKLIAAGEAIDQKDNRGMTALALALQSDELEAVQRLLDLGAGLETPVTSGNIPVALLPVMDRNFPAIALLRRTGVDYSKLRYRDATAVELVKQIGDSELLQAMVGTESSTL
jgi:tetratricopeptide (TPR) repeat protein